MSVQDARRELGGSRARVSTGMEDFAQGCDNAATAMRLLARNTDPDKARALLDGLIAAAVATRDLIVMDQYANALMEVVEQ